MLSQIGTALSGLAVLGGFYFTLKGLYRASERNANDEVELEIDEALGGLAILGLGSLLSLTYALRAQFKRK